MDVEMKDAPIVEVPSTFEFDFDMDDFDPAVTLNVSRGTAPDGSEPRSPRTPTYTGSACQSGSISPFNPDRFFVFPLLTTSQDSSSLTALPSSPAAQSHLNLSLLPTDSKESQLPDLPTPPESPLPWIWTCHLCRSKYPLSATRRCLIDGHYYCSGQSSTSTQKNVKRKRRGQSCSSEFDYVGWQEWGNWKRKAMATRRNTAARSGKVEKSCSRGCAGCEYPSQCRYEKTNSVPAVVTAVLPKVVERDVEAGTTSVRAEDGNSLTSIAKKRLLTVDTALLEIGGTAKHTHMSISEAVTATSPDPTSPDLVDFSSILGTSLTDGRDHASEACVALATLDSVIGDGVEDYKQTVEKTSTLVPKLTRGESRKKKRRSSVKESVAQSRISDFFGITR